MKAGAVYLYPWDVAGDPDAARRVAGTGAAEVALAAVYHDVRAITPFHPAHRIVANRAGALYPGSFERAAGSLREAGLSVTAWVVVTHNEAVAAAHPDRVVRNAFGDPYPWALCCANPSVGEYAATVAAEVAGLDCVDRVELEACGWYGFDHLSAHDKTGGAGGWLLDLCWCPSCEAAFAAAGVDVPAARAQVRAAIDAGAGLGAELAAVIAGVRTRLAGEFLWATVAAVGKPVLVQADADPLACGANPGFAADDLAACDDIVVNCFAGGTEPVVAARAAAPGIRIGAGVLAVAAPGVPAAAHRDGLIARAGALRAAGASGLRFYHAGLARAGDLAAIREAIARLGPASGSCGAPASLRDCWVTG